MLHILEIHYIITILSIINILMTAMNGIMTVSLMIEIIFFETACPVPQVGFELTMQPRMASDSEYPSSTS